MKGHLSSVFGVQRENFQLLLLSKFPLCTVNIIYKSL